LAVRAGVPIIPVAQWGAHEVLAWHGWGAMALTLLRSVWRRPVVRVHFGAPLDLADIDAATPGAAQRATDRLMGALTEALVPLRAAEPRLPRYVDPTRPVSTARRLHHPATDWIAANLAGAPGGSGTGRNVGPTRVATEGAAAGGVHAPGSTGAQGPSDEGHGGLNRGDEGGAVGQMRGNGAGRGRHRRTGAVPSVPSLPD
jgi:hypothetical protein